MTATRDAPDAQLITEVIAAHGLWKYRLHEAIRTGSSAFSVEAVRADNRCVLGQWLYRDTSDRPVDGSQEPLRALHARFHVLTSEILEQALAGEGELAQRSMDSGSEFLQVSAELVRMLHARQPSKPGIVLDGSAARVPASDVTAADPAARAFLAELVGTSLETEAQATVASCSVGTVEAGMEALAAATEELTATIHEIARNSAHASDTTEAASASAVTFAEHVTELVQAIAETERVLASISKIAGQTNLLALNAAIEAARAGDTGMGFRVVADEVKHLSRETAAAAADVTERISLIQARACQTVAEMGDFTERIQSAQAAQSSIAAAIEEQSAATAEIARGVASSAQASQQISENVAAVALAARCTAAAAERL